MQGDLNIEVRLADIEAGIPRDGERCAIAQAICRQMGVSAEELFIEVDGRQLTVTYNGGEDQRQYELPDEAVAFQTIFDTNKEEALPISFKATEYEFFED